MIEQAGRLDRNSWLALAPAEDGYWAYDVQTSRLHHLNPVAALIIELCDGSLTAEEISTALAPVLAGHPPDATSRWIEGALADGLLLSLGTSPVSLPQPSAADFTSAAERLRNEGYVLAAFVCQRHAASLSPEDAQYWKYLGELAHIIGRRADAREAYEQYLALHPGDDEIGHIMISLRDEAPPPRASDSCIQQLYARFSEFYEDNMLGDLEYKAPELLGQALDSNLGDRSDMDVLELGSGTGLAAPYLRKHARKLIGIDLSPEMLEQAEKTGRYDRLEVAEITKWLGASQKRDFDLIAACDTLIYFGDLPQVLIPATKRLRSGGWMAFTVEAGDTVPFRMSDSGRYQHSKSHITEAAVEAGFTIAQLSEAVLRYEYGEEVKGFVVVLFFTL
ncbi:MAG TPA: methyltransferase domain-containing protein [Terriglobia bacterium]|nr:methyltransferase domain-containing protein [Terriglobia bacterium]